MTVSRRRLLLFRNSLLTENLRRGVETGSNRWNRRKRRATRTLTVTIVMVREHHGPALAFDEKILDTLDFDVIPFWILSAAKNVSVFCVTRVSFFFHPDETDATPSILLQFQL